MPKKKKALIIAAVAALVAVFLAVALVNALRTQGGGSGPPKGAVAVEVEAARLETIVCKASVKGTVELVDSETVFPKTNAIVGKIHVKAGDQVAAGQRLLDYDEKAISQLRDGLDDAKLALKAAELGLKAARTPAPASETLQMENARAKYDSAKALNEAGAMSKSELDAAYEAMRLAEDQVALSKDKSASQTESQQVAVEQARAKVSQIQKEIDEYAESETAPRDGTVISVSVKEGDVSGQGRPLFEIADVSAKNLVVKANVPENDARNLALGQEAEIRCNAAGQGTFYGKVSKIAPVAERKQSGSSLETTVAVEISCEAAPFKAGYTVDAVIVTRTIEDAVVAPLMSTISETGGKSYVYVMRDDWSVEKRLVELGEYSGVYVEAGNLEEGEKLVLNPPAQLAEGSFVKPVAARDTGS